jgi:hypothetical protein
MRLLPLVLACAIVLPAALAAQDSSAQKRAADSTEPVYVSEPPMSPMPTRWTAPESLAARDTARAHAAATGLRWYAHDRAKAFGLLNLEDALPRPGRHELRLWYGFGLFGVGLVRLWDDGRWHACLAPAEGEIDRDGALARTPPAPSARVRRAWTTAVAAGMLRLPAEPPPRPAMVLDGEAFVFEWFDGKRFGWSVADNPDSFRTPSDLLAIRVEKAFFKALGPVPRCGPEPGPDAD